MKTTANQRAIVILAIAGLTSVIACQSETTVPCPPGLSDICYTGTKGTAGIGPCQVGVRLCFEHNGKIVERCEDEITPAAEVCDSVDNNCDGATDEGGICNADIVAELERNIDDLESRTGPLWAFTRPGRSGPTLLTGQHWSPFFRCADTTTPRECADAFIYAEAAALGLSDPDAELVFNDEFALAPDSEASVFVRYQQVHGDYTVQSGGVLILVRDHRVMSAEVYNVPVVPDAPTTATISEAEVVTGLPAGSTVVDGPTLKYVPDDPTLPLETQTHVLAYVAVYQRTDDDVYERVVDAVTGAILRDTSVRNDQPVLSVDGSAMQPAAGTPQRRAWDKTTDTYDFVDGMPVAFTGENQITLVDNPNLTWVNQFNVNIVTPAVVGCGVAVWHQAFRQIRLAFGMNAMGQMVDCTANLAPEHEAYHLVYGPYMQHNNTVADEEAIHHGFVDIGSLLVECLRQLAAGAINCSWQTNYSSAQTAPQAFQMQGYAAAVPITTGMGGNWTDTSTNFQATANKLLFGAPIVRTLIRWGVSEDNVRRMQYLMDATSYRLPRPGGVSGMNIEEFAAFMIATCHAASADVLRGLSREYCSGLQIMFDAANVTPYCELFSDEEYCNGADDNCDGYIDNCLNWDDCCGWRHLTAFSCNEDNERRQDYSLTDWCYSGSVETDGIGVCRAGFRTCEAAGINSASWSSGCIGEVAPAQEICDPLARDENCNGEANEEAVRVPCVFDADNDGVPGSGPVSMRCACSGRWLPESAIVDCNDGNARVFPRAGAFDEGANGLCNTVDDDCDGIMDEGCPCNPLVNLPRPCGPASDLGPLCIRGIQRCMWDPAAGGNRWTEECSGDEWGAYEICNGVDDDCDGFVDNTDPQGMVDIDPADACFDDRYPVPCLGRFACEAGRRVCRGDVRPETCNGLDDDCDGVADDGLSGNPESCDGADNNCNDAIDEGLFRDCSNACGIGTESCIGGSWARCTAPTPSPEICNGLDDDCDGNPDNGVCTTCVGLGDLTGDGDAFLTRTGGGDDEFDSHGPVVTVTVSLSSSGRSVCAEVTTLMEETMANWTTGTNTRTVCADAPGTVLEILTPDYSESYTDTNHGWDLNVLPASGVVSQVDCVGDTPGPDICADSLPPDCSLCHVYLGCVEVRYRYE
ncbi:putative metal-binding motif-containing protein [Candidatus Uhrbacteria bacterium]|nr:putative metal-binding motif-containing protein [Candidatus Uhrbacteria bacterium]